MTPQHDLAIRALTDEDWGVIEASCPVCGVQKFHSAYAAHEWHSRQTGGIPNHIGTLLVRGPAPIT